VERFWLASAQNEAFFGAEEYIGIVAVDLKTDRR